MVDLCRLYKQRYTGQSRKKLRTVKLSANKPDAIDKNLIATEIIIIQVKLGWCNIFVQIIFYERGDNKPGEIIKTLTSIFTLEESPPLCLHFSPALLSRPLLCPKIEHWSTGKGGGENE